MSPEIFEKQKLTFLVVLLLGPVAPALQDSPCHAPGPGQEGGVAARATIIFTGFSLEEIPGTIDENSGAPTANRKHLYR